ncbi:hypothetical protein ACFYYR_26640 [Streptomyces sp. NPDC001922]|uniref:LppU/SCO3897 family protein n=1 Tax=Streptomyces sp. NPDC001922 TaxID=3364624 RepID=UPI0036D14476
MASPPPPHGSNPYAQPSAPQPGAPYPPQPGAPYPPQPGGWGAPPHVGAPGYPQGQPAGPAFAGPHAYPYAPQPAPYPGGASGCRFCGAQPAVQATVRGHQGMVVIMRFLKTTGPFCRNCGLATLRDMSANTLVAGWWSPLSTIFTPITLLMNFFGPRSALARLAPPAGGFRPSLDPGRPLTRRPQALLFLVPMLLVLVAIPVLIVIGAVAGGGSPDEGVERAETLSVGDCVRNEGDWKDQDLRITDCGAPQAEYEVSRSLDEQGEKCADGEYYADLKYGKGGTTSLCLKTLW